MIPAGLRHVAVIMDGNGRWARERGWPRTRGHKEGIGAVRECVTESARAGLEWLTLFALSTEEGGPLPSRYDQAGRSTDRRSTHPSSRTGSIGRSRLTGRHAMAFVDVQLGLL